MTIYHYLAFCLLTLPLNVCTLLVGISLQLNAKEHSVGQLLALAIGQTIIWFAILFSWLISHP